MARARVSQRAAITYKTGGRVFKRGEPQIITDASEIARLRATGGFSVTMLADQPPKQKAVEPPPEVEDEFEPAETPEDELAKAAEPAAPVKTAKRAPKRRKR